MREGEAILANLPTSIRGFVYNDENGDPVIVVNARLTREQNLITYDHEQGHIERNELNELTYIEYGGE
jgi:hypothetical protein